MITRTDATGVPIWQHTFGGGPETWDVLNDLQGTSDGGIVATGYTFSDEPRQMQAWLIRLDHDGNQIWDRRYGDPAPNWSWAYDIIALDDGGFAMAGEVWVDSTAHHNGLLIRTTADGTELWRRNYGGAHQDGFSGLVATVDGGFLAVGQTRSVGNDTEMAGWAVRTDGAGTEVWSRTYGTELDDWFEDVCVTEAGFACAGSASGSWVDGRRDGGNAWLVEIDGNGNQLQTHDYDRGSADEAYHLARTTDGGFALGGTSHAPDWSSWNGWILRTHLDGGLRWTQDFSGDDQPWVDGMLQTTDGGFATTGSVETESMSSEIWIVKLAPEAECDLVVDLSGHPSSIRRGDVLSFTAQATNPCEAPLTLDTAVMKVTGPANVTTTLYAGQPVSVAAGKRVQAQVEQPVPDGAPLGTYSVEVSISRDGVSIGSDEFDVVVE